MRDNRAPTRYSNWQESSHSSSESEDEDKESEGEENQFKLEKENMEKKQAAMQTTIDELREQIRQLQQSQKAGGKDGNSSVKGRGLVLNTGQATYLRNYVKNSLYSHIKFMTTATWEGCPNVLEKCCATFCGKDVNTEQIALYKKSVIKTVNDKLMAMRNANLTCWQRVYKGT